MNGRSLGCGALVALLALIVSWAFWAFTGSYVDAGEVGVMYSARAGKDTQNGLLVNADKTVKIYRPGRHYVAPMYELYHFPTKPQLALYSQDALSGDLKQADGIRITTSDTASTIFDVGVLWGVEPEHLGLIFATFGKTDIKVIQSQHLRRALQDAANEIGSMYDAPTLIAPGLEEAGKRLTADMKRKLEPKGFTIYEAFFLRAYPDATIQAKINQRVNIMTGTEIARTHKEKAEIERKTTLITANAQAKARQMTAGKTAVTSLAIMELEADGEAVDAWNGAFSQAPSGKGVNIVLGQGNLSVTARGV